MRVPLTPQLSTKDGEANKNARMTNCLVEKNPTGAQFSSVRPALVSDTVVSGNGNGMVEFNGELVYIFGTSVRKTGVGEIATIDSNFYDFTQSTY